MKYKHRIGVLHSDGAAFGSGAVGRMAQIMVVHERSGNMRARSMVVIQLIQAFHTTNFVFICAATIVQIAEEQDVAGSIR